MESLYILIPIALLLASGAIAAFLWAVRSNQFEDLEMEGKRLLFDDEPTTPKADRTWQPRDTGENTGAADKADE